MLKHFNKTEYKSLGTALWDIKKEFESLQPKDSSDIVWDRTDTGIRPKLIKQSIYNSQQGETTPSNIKVQNVVGYNSYFKIVDASETAEDSTVTYKISIIDGYDRGYNRCKVNNKQFDIDYLQGEVISAGSHVVVLQFSQETEEVVYKVLDTEVLPDDTAEYSYYQIGTVSLIDGVMAVRQDHLSGVAQLFAYRIYTCEDAQ